jgi:hypothetical protein
MPRRVPSEQEQLDQEMREQLEYGDAIPIGDDFVHDF